ncbi:MAG: hypothetical protein ACRDOO_15755 [Actinomadura sp.]
MPADAVGGASVSGAKFGAAVVTGDFNKDGKIDVAVGAPNDTVGGVASGSVSVFPGSATGLGAGKRLRQADAGASDEAGDKWGTALAAGDFNKDGFTDLAVGAPSEMVGTVTSGGISVFPGSASGLTTGQGFDQTTAGGSNEAGDAFGSALAAADFNGDGFADLAIGTPGEIPGGETERGGTVFVYKGSSTGVVSGWATTQEDSGANNTETGDQYGASVAAGNVTGSSHADLVVGAPGEAPGTGPAGAGSVYVVPGSMTGKATGFARLQTHAGDTSEANDHFGAALAVGNFDGDGFADVAVGVPDEAPGSAAAGGSVMIFPGASSALDTGYQVQESQGGEAITAGDKFGSALATGDANGDGNADLLVGAPGKSYGSATAAGAGFLFSGGPRETGSTVSVKLGRRITQPDVQWGNGTNNAFGSATALGDVTGDGKPEAVLGASGEPPSGQPASGSTVVLTNLAPGAAPVVPVEENSPMAGMQASIVGGGSAPTLEYGYVNDVGWLWHGHQSDPDNFNSVEWTVISGAEVYSGRPSLAEQEDGRLQIAAHNIRSSVWVNTQATKDPAVWGNWLNTGGLMASHTTMARQADGTLVVFAIDGNGVLWALHQPSPNAAHTSWLSMGVTGLTGTPAAVTTADGIRVFARDTTGDIKTALYSGRTISGCTGLGGSGLTGTPTAAVLSGNKVWVFARAADGSIAGQTSDFNGVFPGTWSTVGSFTAAGPPSALVSSTTAKVEIVARGGDGIIYSTGETAAGSGVWRDWVRAFRSDDPTIAITDPTAFRNTATSGTSWAFVIRNSDDVPRLYTAEEAFARGDEPPPPTFTGHTLPAPPNDP